MRNANDEPIVTEDRSFEPHRDHDIVGEATEIRHYYISFHSVPESGPISIHLEDDLGGSDFGPDQTWRCLDCGIDIDQPETVWA